MSEPAQASDADAQLHFEILQFIGIASQLSATKANRELATIDLPMPQFALLSHFSKSLTRPQTVTEVAAAFQMPVSGISKSLSKLVDRGFLSTEGVAADARQKHLKITPAGQAAFAGGVARLAPFMERAFDGWLPAEKRQLQGQLRRLKDWLDRNR